MIQPNSRVGRINRWIESKGKGHRFYAEQIAKDLNYVHANVYNYLRWSDLVVRVCEVGDGPNWMVV